MWIWWLVAVGAAMLIGRSESTKVTAAVFFAVGVAFALLGPWEWVMNTGMVK